MKNTNGRKQKPGMRYLLLKRGLLSIANTLMLIIGWLIDYGKQFLLASNISVVDL